MGRKFSPDALAFRADVKKRIIDSGGEIEDFSDIRKKYPRVSIASTYRLIEAVRKEVEGEVAKGDRPAAIASAIRRIRGSLDTPEGVHAKLKHVLPTGPSPAVLATLGGKETERIFDFLGYFHAIVSDVNMLREKSMKRMPDGTMQIVNPALFDRAVNRRFEVLESYMGVMDKLYNLEKIQMLYNVVLEEVTKVSPELKTEILRRLRIINNERGLNASARVSRD